MTKQTARSILAALTVAALASAPAHAGPILEFNSGIPSTFSGIISFGWSFTTGNASIQVGALDAYLNEMSSTQVRLYNAAGTTLASATVTASDTLEGSPIADS